jgi:deazaflavin-dependent oxidoreductase (nitroreductase family)
MRAAPRFPVPTKGRTMFTNVAHEEFAYLTTTGRRTGASHEVEIWFAADGDALWMISGGRDHSDWVRNLLAAPAAVIRIADAVFAVQARPGLTQPDERRAAAEALVRQVRAAGAGVGPGLGGGRVSGRVRSAVKRAAGSRQPVRCA